MSSVSFQSFRFTEEDHQILESLFGCDESGSYTVRVPAGHWLGAWKFKMVSEWGENGASLYHKLRDGLEAELVAHRAGTGSKAAQEISVTLKRSDGDKYAVDKVETSRTPQLSSDYTMDWRQLAMEGSCPLRTRTPPSLLFIRGHAKFEGQKLANIHRLPEQKKKGNPFKKVHYVSMFTVCSMHTARKVHTSKAISLSKVCVHTFVYTQVFDGGFDCRKLSVSFYEQLPTLLRGKAKEQLITQLYKLIC